MEILDASQTAARLPYPGLAASIREVAHAKSASGLQAPARLALQDGGVPLIMPL
ncbi:MAG TPA: hypothetical protein VE691_00730 [Rubrobacter sp.]|nr:hypothetical protein [Rubrobacter sp.]